MELKKTKLRYGGISLTKNAVNRELADRPFNKSQPMPIAIPLCPKRSG